MHRLKRAIFLVAILIAIMAASQRPALAGPAAADGAADPFNLAVRLENGESIAKDYRHALVLYCRAADKGDTRALLNLGWMYLNGRGVAQNNREAVFWLRKAAARGVPQAANLLGLLAGVAPSDPGCPRSLVVADHSAFSPVTIHPAAAPPLIRAAVEETAREAGLSGDLLLSMVAVESAFDAHAVSAKSAMGLMQLMPGTAERFGVRDPFDYRENLRGGAFYIRLLLQRYGGNLTFALAAYNAGEGAVASYGGVPPFRETKAFVEQVKRLCGCDANAGIGLPMPP